jgi:hypothetical protein
VLVVKEWILGGCVIDRGGLSRAALGYLREPH